MESTNLSLMISCKYALWGQIALPSLMENAQSYNSSHCNIWISASSASPFLKSFFRWKSLSKNVVLQKCWLASFRLGWSDWKTSFWVGFFLGHFLQQGLPSFPDLLAQWKWFYWCFHSLQNVSYFPRMLQYKYSPPPRCVAVCAEGWGRYIWVSLSAPKDSLSKGPHLQCVSAVRVAVQRAGGDCAGGGAGLSFLPPLCGTSLLMLYYWVWTPGMWAAASSVTSW